MRPRNVAKTPVSKIAFLARKRKEICCGSKRLWKSLGYIFYRLLKKGSTKCRVCARKGKHLQKQSFLVCEALIVHFTFGHQVRAKFSWYFKIHIPFKEVTLTLAFQVSNRVLTFTSQFSAHCSWKNIYYIQVLLLEKNVAFATKFLSVCAKNKIFWEASFLDCGGGLNCPLRVVTKLVSIFNDISNYTITSKIEFLGLLSFSFFFTPKNKGELNGRKSYLLLVFNSKIWKIT